MTRNAAVFLFIWASVASTAYAQEAGRNELGLLLGVHVTPALTITDPGGDIDLKSGVTFQATYARHLVEGERARLSAEIPMLAAPTVKAESANANVPIQYASLFLTPGLRVTLQPGATFSPWLSIGAGYALFEQASEVQNGAANFNTALRHTGAAQFGAGVDIRTPLRILFPIALRGEIRDLYSGKPEYNVETGGGWQHNLVVSGGFVIHF